MPRFDLTTIGEACIRFGTRVGESLAHAPTLDVQIAGAEGNVAGALAALGWRSGWVSRLPEGPLADRVLSAYRDAGTDLVAVRRCAGERIGTLFVERRQGPRATRIAFDRRDSAFTRLTPDDVDWAYLLDTRLLHLTGITSPLSPSVRDVVAEAVRHARAASVPISYDVNYRRHLWPAADARAVSLELGAGAEVLFCSLRDAQALFDAPADPPAALELLHQLTGARAIVMSHGSAGTVARLDGVFAATPSYPAPVVDRIGAGDALAAGCLHGWLRGDLRRGLEYGAIMAAVAMTQPSELVVCSHDELERILDDGGGGLDR